MRRFAERWSIPVVAGFRCQDSIDNTSSSYIGHLGFDASDDLVIRVESADLVIAIGGHFGDVETDGYTRRIGAADATIVHLAVGVEDLDRAGGASLAAVVSTSAAIAALDTLEPTQPVEWADTAAEARREYLRFSHPPPGDPLAQMINAASTMLAAETVICNGAGNYAAWLHRYFTYTHPRTQLAPANGAMGFGLPAGIAAAVGGVSDVVVFAGDGCFAMASPEMATAVAEGIRVIVVVVNNGVFGTILMHQEREFPGRAIGTTTANPDFVALATASGFAAEQARTVDDFRSALARALARTKSTLIEVDAADHAISPRAADVAAR